MAFSKTTTVRNASASAGIRKTPESTARDALSFSSLPLDAAQHANLDAIGYTTMTPIQAASLPAMLAGHDVLARARTGSGKTAAFGLAVIHRLRDAPRLRPQALVLCPTRELADQVLGELRQLARARPNTRLLALVGGRPMQPQRQSLEHGAHILVGTPGRMLDHLNKGSLDLGAAAILVLDEADRMLDMGFADAMDAIIACMPSERQTLLFSATYPDTIATMSRRVQRDPCSVSVDATHPAGAIEQSFYATSEPGRGDALLALYQLFSPASSLVFCQTRRDTETVARLLREHRIESLALHGDLDQAERDAALVQFANGSCPVIVATDVAARGLDVPGLEMVFNYELPRDAAVYQHRIGRTGRAGESGLAASLFVPRDEGRLDAIAVALGQPCRRESLPASDLDPQFALKGAMATLEVNAGRKQKLRPGDLLGALTGEGAIPGASIGKISIFDKRAFIGIDRAQARAAVAFLAEGKVKGRRLKVRRLR